MDSQPLFLSLQDKLPKDMIALNALKERLDSLSPAAREELSQQLLITKLKSPVLVFWVGSFIFGNLGVGRFMIGDTLLGVLRLLLWIISFALDVSHAPEGAVIAVGVAMCIWWVVDLFLTGKKLRAKNLAKVYQMIESIEKGKPNE